MNIRKSLHLLPAVLVLFAASLACAVAMPAAPGGDPAQPVETAALPVSEATPNPGEPVETPAGADHFLADGDILAALYERVHRGVVVIRIVAGGLIAGQGSGFVIDGEGHIVTNYHVIEGATAIEVAFWNGFKTRGTVIGTDLDSDLAVLSVEVPDEQLHPLTLGDSDLIRVGDVAVAIGSPFGLGSTMTVGVVSAKGRVLTSLNITEDGRPFSAGDLIQTDAAINPGNSGGPLLNILGEVIGVNRAIQTESFTTDGSPANSGIGFAISVNILKRVAPSLIADGSYSYPFLGVSSLSELTIFDQEEFNLPQSTGALVTLLTENGPAATGGVRVGDLITHIDEREVIVFGDLLGYLILEKSPGDEVVLTVIRGGETLEITVTLGAR
ncbi:MAG TPA: trypsin-like peptidase domain-containing protein [Anaerolineales bacterium]|nr:trypsin-like peptidase domain-containing protein [Anaerolineales bacterium]